MTEPRMLPGVTTSNMCRHCRGAGSPAPLRSLCRLCNGTGKKPIPEIEEPGAVDLASIIAIAPIFGAGDDSGSNGSFDFDTGGGDFGGGGASGDW